MSEVLALAILVIFGFILICSLILDERKKNMKIKIAKMKEDIEQFHLALAIISENNLEEDLLKASFQEVADSSGHLIVKRSPINVAKRSSKGQKDTKNTSRRA